MGRKKGSKNKQPYVPRLKKYHIDEGMVFEHLTVTGRLVVKEQPGRLRSMVPCTCVCGNTLLESPYNLVWGKRVSCGCKAIERSSKANTTHGLSRSRIYKIWAGMHDRCYGNDNQPYYKNYGGRGITICDQWYRNFDGFYRWSIVSGYQDNLTLDRINNNLGYSPDNCRWATSKQQARNTRVNRVVSAFDESKALIEWSEDERCVVPYDTLLYRVVTAKWDVERALTTPAAYRKKSNDRHD